jgi:predicted 3-demethylubiquinone-9 3-methyltransferase (glyoxalase superfamily)
MQKITPCLWFDDKAEEAVNFYASVFNKSKIKDVTRYRSYATVGNRKSKGIESYMGGKTLCLSHFGYTS